MGKNCTPIHNTEGKPGRLPLLSYGEIPKLWGVPYFGALIIGILLFRGTLLGSPIFGNPHILLPFPNPFCPWIPNLNFVNPQIPGSRGPLSPEP